MTGPIEEKPRRRDVLKTSASFGALGFGIRSGAVEDEAGDGRGDDGTSSLFTTGDSEPSTYGEEPDVLLVKDCQPWHTDANETVLRDLDVAYERIPSSGLGDTDLRAFGTVVLPSTQDVDYYERLEANREALSRYVEAGGTLVSHVMYYGYPCDAGARGNYLPGGVTAVESYSTEDVVITDPAHPSVSGLSSRDIDKVNLAIADLANVPDSATVVATNSSTGEPAYVEYGHGSGQVIATGLLPEFGFYRNYGETRITKELLYNELEYATGLADPPGGSTPTLDDVVDEKRSLATHIDGLSNGLARDRQRVEPATAGLVETVDAGGITAEKAARAVARMREAETVTDAVLAGGGPGDSEYLDGGYNLSRQVARYATYPLVDLLIGLFPIPYALRNAPLSGGLIRTAEDTIETVLSDLLRRYFPGEVAEFLARKLSDVAGAVFDILIERTASEGQQLSVDTYEEVREQEVSALLTDEAEIVFTQAFFSQDWNALVDSVEFPSETVDESLGRLVETLDADDGGPTLDGSESAATRAAEQGLARTEQLLEDATSALEWGVLDDLISGATPVLDAVEIIAAVVGVVTKNPYVIAYQLGVSFVNQALNVFRNAIKWGTAWVFLIVLRRENQRATTNVLAATPPGVA